MKKYLKEKLKNKFILIIVLIITLVLGIGYYIKPKINTNTYVVLVKGNIEINNKILEKDNRKKLKIGDIIITKQSSACVIEWGDGSLTRLGENGKIEIEELNVEEDLSKINLQFKLINGKTWSNVVSYLGEESYFKQNFKDKNSQDIEAAVRGTIFDVNLEKDYIYVTNHEVKAINKKENKTKIIPKNKPFSISTFSFIEIEKFLKNIVDKKWLNENTKLDTHFLNNLKENISQKIDLKNIDNILEENKTYKDLLSQYQKLNFVSASDSKLFEAKNKIKKQLIKLAPEEEKANLIKYSIYDLKDALDLDNIDKKTKETINNITEIIGDNTSDLKDILGEKFSDFNNIIKNIDLKSVKNKAEELRDNAINKIGELLKK